MPQTSSISSFFTSNDRKDEYVSTVNEKLFNNEKLAKKWTQSNNECKSSSDKWAFYCTIQFRPPQTIQSIKIIKRNYRYLKSLY